MTAMAPYPSKKSPGGFSRCGRGTPFSGVVSLAVLLLLVCLPSGQSYAQSLLSLSPGAWERSRGSSAEESSNETDGEEAPFHDRAASQVNEVPLSELFNLVDDGKGHRAYPALAARWERELEKARAQGEDVAGLRRKLLIYLLRAGEGYVSSEVQENFARLFTSAYPDGEKYPLAYFYLNHALYLQGKPLEQSFFFDEDALGSLPPWMQSRYLTMKANTSARRGDFLAAAGFLLAEHESSDTLRETSREEVENMLAQLADSSRLDDFIEKHDDSDWLEKRRPFLQARILANRGELARALLAVNRLVDEGLASSPAQIKSVHATRAEISERVLTASGRIGVLLPLGSSSASLRELATETLNGLRMAIREVRTPADGAKEAMLDSRFAADLQGGTEAAVKTKPGEQPLAFELIVRDTGNNPARAARMVEELARVERVIAIVGPIARSESAAAAARAEAIGVPLISFSLTLKIPPSTRFVFRHSKSQEEEVRNIVRYAMDYAGARRFAVLYPKGGYGERIGQLFWHEVERRGGRIVGIEAYTPQRGRGRSVGLKEIFERFTGLDRPQDEVDLALMEAVGDSKPDAIVDFDALFIPVGPTGSEDLRQIAPYPVTVDAENVLLLGNRFWNSDEVVVAGGGKLEGAVLVDAYDRKSRVGRLRNFRRRHRIMFGHRGDYRTPSYYTAFAYDTVNLLKKLLKGKQGRGRKALARMLVNMQPYSGVTGLTSFLETGEAVKETMFFSIIGGDIRRIVP